MRRTISQSCWAFWWERYRLHSRWLFFLSFNSYCFFPSHTCTSTLFHIFFFFLSSNGPGIFLRSRLANLFCNMPCCAVCPAADAVQHSTAYIWKNDRTVLKNRSLLLLDCRITGALLIIQHHDMDDIFRNNITEN